MGWLTPRAEVKAAADGLMRFFGGSLPDPEFPGNSFLSHVDHGFNRSELVFRCVSEAATSMPEGTLRVYDALGRRGEPIQDHPLRALLANPNPLLSEYEMFEIVSQHLDLAGIAAWEKVRDRAGRVAELWPLRPDKIRMKRDGRSVSYGYVAGSRIVPVEVVFFRLPNPVDPLVGAAPMRSALRATVVDNEATSFVRSLLQNSAVPGVVVTMGELETVLDEEVTRRLSAKWKARYSGERRGEPAFLQAGMDVKQLGLNLKDLEFPDLRAVSETRICSAFSTPPMLVGAKAGLDRATYSNMTEARKAFWEQKILPRQRRVRDTIAAQLLPDVDPGGRGRRRVSIRWDNSEVAALKEAEQTRWERATNGLRAGGMTVNDWRREVGLSEVEGGDVFLVPSGVIAIRDMAGATELVAAQQPAEPETGSDDAAKRYGGAFSEALDLVATDLHAALTKRADLDPATWASAVVGPLREIGMDLATASGKATWDGYNADQTEMYQYRRSEGTAADWAQATKTRAAVALLDPEPHKATAALVEALRSEIEPFAAGYAAESADWGIREAAQQRSVKERT